MFKAVAASFTRKGNLSPFGALQSPATKLRSISSRRANKEPRELATKLLDQACPRRVYPFRLPLSRKSGAAGIERARLRGAMILGCASLPVSNSAKRKIFLQSRLRLTGKTESAKSQAIRGLQRNPGNARSSFAGLRRPRPDGLRRRCAGPRDRECRPESCPPRGRKSTDGSLRSRPFRMSGSISASA